MKIIFPAFNNQRYWDIHYKYMLSLFEYLGCEIRYTLEEDFFIIINGRRFYISISDYPTPNNYPIKTLKFHCNKEEGNAIAFSPVSFDNWDLFYSLNKQISYKAQGIISCRQLIYGNAIERRTKIQSLLNSNFSPNIRTNVIPQEEYFKEIPNCLVSVCIPGQNNNMLDRGQFQYMGLGVCTISPNLPEILPFNKCLIDGTHYLKCKDNYSDLIQIIEWCKSNKNKCLEIGQNAKSLFLETSTPEKLVSWIENN